MSFYPSLEDGEEIAFLTLADVEAIHSHVLFPGQIPGFLKQQDLESALSRPANHYAYAGQQDLIALAAVLWHGVTTAHGFVDGNKRTGLQAAMVFLEMNGVELHPNVPGDEPGRFVWALFQDKAFSVVRLEHYLRTRCRWIEE